MVPKRSLKARKESRTNFLIITLYFLLVTHYNLIVTCYFLFVTRYFLLVTRYLYTLLFFTCDYLLVTRYYLSIFVVPVDNHQLPDINDQMSKSKLILWNHMLEALVPACFKAWVLSCRRILQQYSHDTCFLDTCFLK